MKIENGDGSRPREFLKGIKNFVLERYQENFTVTVHLEMCVKMSDGYTKKAKANYVPYKVYNAEGWDAMVENFCEDQETPTWCCGDRWMFKHIDAVTIE